MVIPQARRHQVGGTTLGILIGIVIGLAIAVGTALFVTRSTLPFVGPAARPGDQPTPPPATAAAPDSPQPKVAVAPGQLPDPNQSPGARQRGPGQPALERTGVATVTTDPAAPPNARAPASSEAAQGTAISAAPAQPQTQPQTQPQAQPQAGARPVPGGAAPIREATPSRQSTTAAVADGPATYVLQAGAFRGAGDADAMKLKLALMGLEAQVVTAEVSGSPLYRVRVGPYEGLDAMNRARARLAENGVEATVLRQR
jgi:cell division protein FtsN